MTIDEYTTRIAENWPPLTPAQNELILRVLTPPAEPVALTDRRSA